MPDIAKLSAALSTIELLIWVLVGLGIAIAAIYAIKWAIAAYKNFTTVDFQPYADAFTPHDENGNVAPKDIAPKGTDPIDWLFMQHPDPT